MSEAARKVELPELMDAAEVAEACKLSKTAARDRILGCAGYVRNGRALLVPVWHLEPGHEEARSRFLDRLGVLLRKRRLEAPVFGPLHSTYVIGADGVPLVKIGQTIDLARRFEGLVAGSPAPLHVLAHLRGRDVEIMLHAAFCEYRSHAEWFAADPVLAFLRDAGVLHG